MSDTDRTDPIPRINSIWRAKDGRTFRVLGSHKRGIGADEYVGVILSALPPLYPRQRRKTELRSSCFGVGKFLEPVS